jgi:hypothetical protein
MLKSPHVNKHVLLQGAFPTILGILPYSGIKFYTYQKLKRTWADAQAATAPSPALSPHAVQNPSAPKPPLLYTLVFGGCAGLVAQTLTYPLDIIRRRMQVSGLASTGAPRGVHGGVEFGARSSALGRAAELDSKNLWRGGGVRGGMFGTARGIIQQHGWLGLFRGVHINYIKVTPATAVGFTVYDQMKTFLGLENHL